MYRESAGQSPGDSDDGGKINNAVVVDDDAFDDAFVYVIGQPTNTATAPPVDSHGHLELMSDGIRARNHSLGNGYSNPSYVGESRESSVDNLAVRDEDCGCGRIRPRFLRKCNNAVCLLIWLSLAAFTQSLLVNGLVSVVITTIEKRYHLSSSQSGLIASSYDIASLIALLPVSYFGGAGRRPRWLGAGVAIVGAGSLLFSVPHFVSGIYDASENATNLCFRDGLSTAAAHTECGSPLSRFRYIFIFAQLLHGVGAAPLYTLGVSFLDDSVKSSSSSLFVGIYYAFSTLGPAVGFLIGGQLLSLYIDFDSVSSWTLTESSPGWLGAWWLGFLVLGSICIMLSVPLLFFPAILPKTRKYQAGRTNETHGDVAEIEEATHIGFGGSLRDLPKAVKLLLMNKTFVCISFAGAADAFMIGGLATYAPKIIQSQFGYSASIASIIVGGATIPMGAGGTFLGGLLVKRLKLKCPGILKFCIICSTLALAAICVFLIKCPNEKFAGVSTPYIGSQLLLTENLISTCNADCRCPKDAFDPVCGISTNTMFLTPCHAGCAPGAEGDATMNFYNCSCIGVSTTPVAKRMACPVVCANLNYVFIAIIALLILFTFLTSIPSVSATLRCVTDSQRPFSLGVQWIIIRGFGAVPGPICFGMIIDTVCSYWQKEPCGNGSGRCLVYDNAGLSNAIFATAVAFKAVTVLFFILSWYLYKPPLVKPDALKANSSENPLTAYGLTPSRQSLATN